MKRELGQYFTIKNSWLTKPVFEFICSFMDTESTFHFLDPFAGNGDLLNEIKETFCDFKKIKMSGYDIDDKLNWKINDSLVSIPIKFRKTFIVTNPPYLAKNSCKRRGFEKIYKYFEYEDYDDIYLIAMKKMIESNVPGIAIVPETFINSKFSKDFIERVVIIEPNPFLDTETPICVVCFTPYKNSDFRIYKNNKYIGKYLELKKYEIMNNGEINLYDLRFNDVSGQIAIKCFDSTNPNQKIKFVHTNNLNYDIKKIKNSSRAVTIVQSLFLEKLMLGQITKIIDEANLLLSIYRNMTKDVLLSPFKGNDKLNVRRRRLDFKLAREIIEAAYNNVIKEKELRNEQR